MASVGEQRPYAIENGFDLGGLSSVMTPVMVNFFDLKNGAEWGEPGPPTAVPDMPNKLGPCMCRLRRHR
jgi:hypothetical protein